MRGRRGVERCGKIAMPALCSADRWCWRDPRPAGNDYDHVYASAADNVWLIGQHGTVLQWDGVTWRAHHPPVLAGAVHVRVAEALPRVAAPMTGAPGVVAGVTGFDGADALPVPTALTADTWKV